jgi:hypothetical protein
MVDIQKGQRATSKKALSAQPLYQLAGMAYLSLSVDILRAESKHVSLVSLLPRAESRPPLLVPSLDFRSYVALHIVGVNGSLVL